MDEKLIYLAELLTDRTELIYDRIDEIRPYVKETANLCYEAEFIKKMIIELDLPASDEVMDILDCIILPSRKQNN